MGPYDYPVVELVWRQINRDNPHLPYPLTGNNVVLLQGPLTTNLGSSGRNTRAIFNGVVGSGFSGKIEVFYDRLNLSQMFNGLEPKVAIPYLATTRAQMLDAVNKALGLRLTRDDINYPDNLAANTTAKTGRITFSTSATNSAMVGQFTIQFEREDPTLKDVWLPENDGRVEMWSNFAFGSRIFDRSFQQWSSILSAVPRNTPLRNNNAATNAFVAKLQQLTGLPFEVNSVFPANPSLYDITDATMAMFSVRQLPDASPKFLSVFVLTPIPGKHRWTEPLYFHVSPRQTENWAATLEDLENFIDGSKLPVYGSAMGIPSAATFAVDMGALAATHVMQGTPWGGNGVRFSSSWATRCAQHCFPDKASFDYAVEHKLRVVITTSGLVGVSVFPSVARNGYTSSLSGTSGNDGTFITKFIYLDAATLTVKFNNPYNGSAGTVWVP